MQAQDLLDPVIGSVAAGTFELRVHAHSGAVARRLGRDISVRERQASVDVAPALKNFINRSREVQELTSGLMNGRALFELWGPPGVGKTALVRELLSDPMVASFDGVLRLRGSSGYNDMLQMAFETAYDTERLFAPTGAQRERYLTSPRLLVVVDDFDGDEEDAEALYLSLPASSFIFVSEAGGLRGAVESIEVAPLSPADNRALYDAIVSRDGTGGTGSLPAGAGVTPLEIVRMAAARRVTGTPVADPAAALAALTGALSATDSLVLAPFLVAAGGPLDALTAGELAGLPGPGPILDSLSARGLVDFDGERYRVRPEVLEALPISVTTQRVANALSAVLARIDRRPTPSELCGFARAANRVLEAAGTTDLHEQAIVAGKLLSTALLLGGRMDHCRETLQIVLDIARRERDRDAEAWALHQLGTIAFAGGDDAAGQTSLSRALELRERLKDEAGVIASRNNLSLLLGVSGSPSGASSEMNREFRLGPVLWGVGAGLVALIIGSLLIFNPFARHRSTVAWHPHPRAHAVHRSPGLALGPALATPSAVEAVIQGSAVPEAAAPPPAKAAAPPAAHPAAAAKASAKPHGPAPKQVAAAVLPAVHRTADGGEPAVDSFGASPATVAEGEYAQLCYAVRNAQSAYIDGYGAVSAKGSHCVTVRATQTHTYALVLTGSGQRTKAFTTLSVTATASKPEPPEPTEL